MCVLKFLKILKVTWGIVFFVDEIVSGGAKVAPESLFSIFPSIMSCNVFMPISLRWGKMCLFPNSVLFHKKPLNFCIFGPRPCL